jgi:DNA-binding NarL/FixJ family response regulator
MGSQQKGQNEMPNDHCDIQGFFGALVSGNHARRIPAQLTRLAESVLRYDGLTRTTADDLVAELLRRLMENDMRLVRDDLARFTEADLERVLRFRLRQIATENRPRWPLVRALRGQVRAVLAAGLPGPGSLPASLESRFRLDPAAVARAAAHFVDQGTPATIDSLSSKLLYHYFGAEQSVDEIREIASQALGPEELVQRHLDGRAAAAEVWRDLNERQRHVLALTCAGHSLTDVANDNGVAVSTAFAWRAAVSGVLSSVARRLGVDHDTMAVALETLPVA